MPVSVNSERKGVALVWDEVDEAQEVTVFAIGSGEDVHNKLPQPNNGEAGVFFPANFAGAVQIEVRDGEGNVVSEGRIEV